MPKRKKNAGEPTMLEEVKSKFLERAGELWDLHGEEIFEVLNESESRKVVTTFKLALDCSESSATVKTTVSFSQVHTDERTDEIENQGWEPTPEPVDPNQENLPIEE